MTLKGIKLYRFTQPASALANSTENPANEGFCSDKTGNCPPSGAMSVAPCKRKANFSVNLYSVMIYYSLSEELHKKPVKRYNKNGHTKAKVPLSLYFQLDNDIFIASLVGRPP